MDFNDSFSDKPIFSSYTKRYFFSLKMWKKNTPLQVSRWNIQNPALKKRHARPFLKTATYMRMDLNRDQEIYQKISNQNLN